MKYQYLNEKEIYDEKANSSLRFLYNTVIGRIVLKILTTHFVSKVAGAFFNSRLSTPMIKSYIKKYNIDISICEDKKYKSFNEFFKRNLKEGYLENKSKNSKDRFISTANSRITYYEISDDLLINVKNSIYSISELIQDDELAKEYEGGICLIYRLSPDNYHRYIFCDDGTQEYLKSIKGKLHTVNPIIYEKNKYKVYTENYREVSILDTEHFGKIIQIEVGAMCVGKIKNHKEIIEFKKYEEKGYFEFGGSTIIQLIKKYKVKINKQIVENSKNDIETYVSVGDVLS